jgi:hypothetical protein
MKLKGLKGIIPHALIVFLCCVALSWPYLSLPAVWFFLIFIGSTHLIQDRLKIKYGTLKCSFWPYVLDQVLHAGTIALIFVTDLKNLPRPAIQANLLSKIYSNDGLMIYLIVLIFATYNGYFMIRCFKDSFIQRSTYNHFDKWYGMVERGFIVSFLILPGPFLFLFLAGVLARPLFYVLYKKRFGLNQSFISLLDMSLSWTVALASGLVFFLLQTKYPIY